MGYCYGEWILVVSFVLFRSVFLYLQTLFVSLCSLLYVHFSMSTRPLLHLHLHLHFSLWFSLM